MNENIKNHVEALFSTAPRSRRAIELKDELISNLSDRYNDLIAQGQDEESAFKTAVAGIGDVDELIHGLREQEIFDPVQVQMQRQKSALLISIAVAIYIVSIIFPIMSGWMDDADFGTGALIGIVMMFVCWAVATMLLVYNALSKPKYVKLDETIVEEFKEWKVTKAKNDSLRKSISSMVWMLTVIIYLALGFFANAWSPGWMVFLLAAVVNHIIKLVYIYRGNE